MSKERELVFRITTEGTMQCLWHPELDRGEIDVRSLGPVTLTRASHIEPVNETGEWEVTLTDGRTLGRFPSHAAAVGAEVQFLQAELKQRRWS